MVSDWGYFCLLDEHVAFKIYVSQYVYVVKHSDGCKVYVSKVSVGFETVKKRFIYKAKQRII